jgi:hypothetical protein
VDAPYDAGIKGKALRDCMKIPLQNWHFGIVDLFQHAASKYFMYRGLAGGGAFTFYTSTGGQAYGIDCGCAQYAPDGTTMIAPTAWWADAAYAPTAWGGAPPSCGTVTQLCSLEVRFALA